MLSRGPVTENRPVSRRRRVLSALLGLAVVAAGATAYVTGRDPARPATVLPAQEPGPVLLVPGYGGATGPLGMLRNRLEREGRRVVVLDLPGDGTGDLREAARALAAAADAVVADGGSVDVVGYSAGGVVARYWVRELGGAGTARRVVSLGSPHHGTDLARYGELYPQLCPLACRQLLPTSDLVTGLNRDDETPEGPQWLTVWSTGDTVVTPPASARLEGAVNVVLQDVCPGLAVTHADLPVSPLVRGLVVRALGTDDIEAPGPDDCATLQALGD